MARTYKEFEWPPSDPRRETERYRDLRDALQQATTRRDDDPRDANRKHQPWRRALSAIGLWHRREGS